MPTNQELGAQVAQLSNELTQLRAAQAAANVNPGVAAAPAAAAATPRRPLVDPQRGLLSLIPEYRGMPGENFWEWLTNFDEVTKAMKLSDADRLDLVPLVLKETAHDVLHALTDAEKADYAMLKTSLTTKFMTTAHLTDAMFRLFNRKQAPYETVCEYGVALHKLGRQAYPAQMEDQLNRSLAELFVRNSLPHFHVALAASNPQTILDGISVAQSVERIELPTAANLLSPAQLVASTPAPSTSVQMPNQLEMLSQCFQFAKELNQMQQQTNQGGNRQSLRGQGATKQGGRTVDGRLVCHYCEIPGHIMATCRRRQNDWSWNTQGGRGRQDNGGRSGYNQQWNRGQSCQQGNWLPQGSRFGQNNQQGFVSETDEYAQSNLDPGAPTFQPNSPPGTNSNLEERLYRICNALSLIQMRGARVHQEQYQGIMFCGNEAQCPDSPTSVHLEAKSEVELSQSESPEEMPESPRSPTPDAEWLQNEFRSLDEPKQQESASRFREVQVETEVPEKALQREVGTNTEEEKSEKEVNSAKQVRLEKKQLTVIPKVDMEKKSRKLNRKKHKRAGRKKRAESGTETVSSQNKAVKIRPEETNVCVQSQISKTALGFLTFCFQWLIQFLVMFSLGKTNLTTLLKQLLMIGLCISLVVRTLLIIWQMNCSHFWKRLTAIVRDCRLLVQLKLRQGLDTSLLASFGSRFCFILSSAASMLHSLWTFAYCGLYKASTSFSCSDILFPLYPLLFNDPETLPAVCFLLAIASMFIVTVQTPNKAPHDKSLAFPSLDTKYLESSVLKLPRVAKTKTRSKACQKGSV